MKMSFLGSIDTLMAGSGLCEALESIHGPNTTRQIICTSYSDSHNRSISIVCAAVAYAA